MQEHIRFKQAFDAKKIRTQELEELLTVKDEMGYITLKVSSIDEVVLSYSIKGFEFLNQGFKELLGKYTEYIPDSFPLILELTGHVFTAEEKKAIQNAIWHEYEFDYAAEMLRVKKQALHAAGGLIFALAFMFYLYSGQRSPMIVDLIWIPLWTLLDSVFSLFMYTIPESRKMLRRLVQRQTMHIVFTEEYDDKNPSDKVLGMYKKDVLKNVLDEQI